MPVSRHPEELAASGPHSHKISIYKAVNILLNVFLLLSTLLVDEIEFKGLQASHILTLREVDGVRHPQNKVHKMCTTVL